MFGSFIRGKISGTLTKVINMLAALLGGKITKQRKTTETGFRSSQGICFLCKPQKTISSLQKSDNKPKDKTNV